MSSQSGNQCQIINYVFDDLNKVLSKFLIKPINSNELCENEDSESNGADSGVKFAAVLKVDGYFLSVFTGLIKTSAKYSELVFRNFLKSFNTQNYSKIVIKYQLVKPKVEVLDYRWNEKIGYLIAERKELEHAMSWLSTLGGAFSALGDSIESCAKVAGKISVQQFKIAFRLGEPPLVARCKLYMALSLIQLGKLHPARKLIVEQFELAKAHNDIKLQNICKGIWSKLQYVYYLQKKRPKKKVICDK